MLVLGLFIGIVAKNRGIQLDKIPFDFARTLVEMLPQLDTERSDLSKLEIVLHLTAVGECSKAGRLLKQHIHDEAVSIALLNNLVVELSKKLKRAKKGGEKTAKILKLENASRNAKICSDRAAGVSAAVLAKRWDLTPGQIRRIIRDPNRK